MGKRTFNITLSRHLYAIEAFRQDKRLLTRVPNKTTRIASAP